MREVKITLHKVESLQKNCEFCHSIVNSQITLSAKVREVGYGSERVKEMAEKAANDMIASQQKHVHQSFLKNSFYKATYGVYCQNCKRFSSACVEKYFKKGCRDFVKTKLKKNPAWKAIFIRYFAPWLALVILASLAFYHSPKDPVIGSTVILILPALTAVLLYTEYRDRSRMYKKWNSISRRIDALSDDELTEITGLSCLQIGNRIKKADYDCPQDPPLSKNIEFFLEDFLYSKD